MKLAGRCPSRFGDEVEWTHLISKIIQKSYSDLLLTNVDRADTWRSSENASFKISCLHEELPDGSKLCSVACPDLWFEQTSSLS